METIIVVGSGASGVHFALSLLEKGYKVTMLDVGYQKEDVLHPNDNINDLKSNLHDPVSYFLGKNFEAFIPPDNNSEYYGIPPSKNHVFCEPPRFSFSSNGFSPLFSFARGGLAETWTGGSYPLNEIELNDFPFSYSEIEPFYEKVADRIGISGAKDDLESFYPFHNYIMPGHDLDPNSRFLLSKYSSKNKYFNEKYNFYMGRSRVALLTQDKNNRKSCNSRGRCLWGCPGDSFYTPSITLEKCKSHTNFNYIPDMHVRYFKYNSENHISGVVAKSIKTNEEHEYSLDKLVLAAGTLSSSNIFLESIYRKTNEIVKLNGLMDNRQILVPFINLRMIGKPTKLDYYQYHQLAICIGSDNLKDNIHGQITTCKAAMIHPIIKSVPCDYKTALYIFNIFHSALGIINVNFSDSRRNENFLSLETSENSNEPRLTICYQPRSNEHPKIVRTIRTLKKALLRLSCVVAPFMTHTRPMGASVHYSGTIPMSEEKIPFTTSKYCQSHDFRNLYFVDGTTFPFLPAKNLTFTLMANSIRVAENAF